MFKAFPVCNFGASQQAINAKDLYILLPQPTKEKVYIGPKSSAILPASLAALFLSVTNWVPHTCLGFFALPRSCQTR
jgi:hypothetical protein